LSARNQGKKTMEIEVEAGEMIGSLRSYDGCCKENITLK